MCGAQCLPDECRLECGTQSSAAFQPANGNADVVDSAWCAYPLVVLPHTDYSSVRKQTKACSAGWRIAGEAAAKTPCWTMAWH